VNQQKITRNEKETFVFDEKNEKTAEKIFV